MFVYPERALYRRVIPKNKVYGHTVPGRALRQKFVEQVAEIVWQYKLAPVTVNLPASTEVQEIQVFSIRCRTAELKEEILRTLDRAIPSLLFFELNFQGKVRFAAAFKRLSEANRSKQFVTTYYWTPWQDASGLRAALPIAINMDGLYQQMLHTHMRAAGLEPREGESLEETEERGTQIRSQELACQNLEGRLRKEEQFNRKVVINTELRDARIRLSELR
jgi:hypothetical protein